MYKIVMFLIAAIIIYKISYRKYFNIVFKLGLIYLIVLAMRLFVLH